VSIPKLGKTVSQGYCPQCLAAMEIALDTRAVDGRYLQSSRGTCGQCGHHKADETDLGPVVQEATQSSFNLVLDQAPEFGVRPPELEPQLEPEPTVNRDHFDSDSDSDFDSYEEDDDFTYPDHEPVDYEAPSLPADMQNIFDDIRRRRPVDASNVWAAVFKGDLAFFRRSINARYTLVAHLLVILLAIGAILFAGWGLVNDTNLMHSTNGRTMRRAQQKVKQRSARQTKKAIDSGLKSLAAKHPHLFKKDSKELTANQEVAAKYLREIERVNKIPDSLVAGLNHEKDSVRSNAASSLGKLGPAAAKDKHVIPALIAALNDRHASVRLHAAKALTEIDPSIRSGVPVLIESLAGQNTDMRTTAMIALGNLGPAAEDAIPALEAALKDSDPQIQQAAKAALVQIKAGEDEDSKRD